MTARTSNNLNSGMRCIKYFLIVINFLFLMTSLLLILVGRTIQVMYGDFSEFLDDHFISVPAFLTAVGATMLLVAVFGVFGALKESTLVTNVYGCLLLVVFILELCAAVFATVVQGQVSEMLVRTMNDALRGYPFFPTAAQAVDFMQTNLACCGVNNLRDWEGILPAPEGTANTTIIVPASCCRSEMMDGTCDYIMEGCFPRMEYIISQSAIIIATGAVSVALVQILGVISAFMLAKTIRRTKSLRETRRWQMHESLGIVNASTKPSYDNYRPLEKSTVRNEPVTYA